VELSLELPLEPPLELELPVELSLDVPADVDELVSPIDVDVSPEFPPVVELSALPSSPQPTSSDTSHGIWDRVVVNFMREVYRRRAAEPCVAQRNDCPPDR
jgi:hypothetical protein